MEESYATLKRAYEELRAGAKEDRERLKEMRIALATKENDDKKKVDRKRPQRRTQTTRSSKGSTTSTTTRTRRARKSTSPTYRPTST